MINNPNKPELDKIKANLQDDTPLFRSVSKGTVDYLLFYLNQVIVLLRTGDNGLIVSDVATHKEVYAKKLWPFADKIITQQFFEL